ncbi:MAG TPA: NUDIX domain-containing protein [Acidimicrobiales bacterium]|nr:NUDIX domain-containing protein [Acidimicrobiales bacterium]
MPKRSAGLLLYRPGPDGPEVLLVHPGGPVWAKKDEGVWSVPKGELEGDEEPRDVAAREFEEELGTRPPAGEWLDLGEVRQRGGKVVRAFATPGDLDERAVVSNTFEMEWPPHSGRRQSFPEVDRAGWFGLETARTKLLAAQVPFIERLAALVAGS